MRKNKSDQKQMIHKPEMDHNAMMKHQSPKGLVQGAMNEIWEKTWTKLQTRRLKVEDDFWDCSVSQPLELVWLVPHNWSSKNQTKV